MRLHLPHAISARDVQNQLKVMAAWLKALAQIYAVRCVASITGIKVNGRATLFACVIDEPVEHRAAITPAPFGLQCGKVINVEHFAPGKKFREAKTGEALYPSLMAQRQKLVSLLLLPAYPGQEFVLHEMRAQGMQYRKTGLDLCIGACDIKRMIHQRVECHCRNLSFMRTGGGSGIRRAIAVCK